MPDYLETTVDKFTFKIATDRLYSTEGVWAKAEGKMVRVGLSDFVQQRSGDVAFAEVKPVGARWPSEMKSPSSKPSRSISAWAPR